MQQSSHQIIKNSNVPATPLGAIFEKSNPSAYRNDEALFRNTAHFDKHAASRLHEIFLIGMMVLALLTLVCLFQLNSNTTHGFAFFLYQTFGWLSYFFPAYLFYVAIIFYKNFKNALDKEMALFRLIGISALFVVIDGIIGTGKLGQGITTHFFKANDVESWIVSIGLLFSSMMLITDLSCFEILYFLKSVFLHESKNKRWRFHSYEHFSENNSDTRRHQNHLINHDYNNVDDNEDDDSGQSALITYQKSFSQPHISDPQSNRLIHCLSQFNISAVVSAKIPGPVITRFELYLAPGTRSSVISTHHKEIARALCVKEVRIIEVIEGKSCIGIEIPNPTRELFSFSEIADDLDFGDEKLPLLLGRTTTGESKTVDLHAMPHLLIAGSTCSGKTMLLQSILMSLTQQHSSHELKIILIDPKQIAFLNWKNLPHLLHPVITDLDEAVNALNWCVAEMQRRYNTLSVNPRATFPACVVIVDEFADLMMSHKSQIEESVTRLAQKARQCDIHLVLATQRPTVDVITGHIKTNMPTRIALSVPEKRDSRIILDEAGAESLLGQGDMLLKINGQSSERLHAPFVSENEIRRHISALVMESESSQTSKENSIQSNITHVDFSKKSPSEKDDLYEEIIAYVRETKKASTTALQNKFKIGYQKAAGMMDRLEADGVIGGRKKVNEPREVF